MMMHKKSIRRIVDNSIAYVILVITSLTFLLPLLWMITTSLKSYEQNLSYPPTWFPSPVIWGNYREAIFETVPFFRYFLNSVFLVVVGTSATLISSTIVAYGFARNKSKLARVLFIVLLATMMLPTQTTMISSYVIWAKLDLINTYVPLLIGCFFGGSAFYIFLIIQFIRSIPIELEEAAKIDGASRMQTLIYIIVPSLKPVLATVAIFSFQAIWNDYMGPLIYIKDARLYTLAQALTLFQMPHETLWGPMMAASIIAIIPVLIIYVCAQRYFISGINVGAVKG
jgi:ABC-type glycerol-3-phosphate transport system permease component